MLRTRSRVNDLTNKVRMTYYILYYKKEKKKNISFCNTYDIKRSYIIDFNVHQQFVRDDALKYWKWSSYDLKSQRSLLYKHLYLSYIYLIIILFSISLCQLKNAIVRSVQPLKQLLSTLDIVEIVPRSFNQRDSELICMYCSLEIAITRH